MAKRIITPERRKLSWQKTPCETKDHFTENARMAYVVAFSKQHKNHPPIKFFLSMDGR